MTARRDQHARVLRGFRRYYLRLQPFDERLLLRSLCPRISRKQQTTIPDPMPWILEHHCPILQILEKAMGYPQDQAFSNRSLL